MNLTTGLSRIIIMFPFLCISAMSSAQSDSLKKSVKMYMNYHYMSNSSVHHMGSSTEEYKFRQSMVRFLSPAVQLTNSRGDFHEMELSNLHFQLMDNKSTLHVDSTGFSQVTGGTYTRSFDIAFRFEYSYRLLKSREIVKVQPYIGLALNPYFSAFSFTPKVSSGFPGRSIMLGNQFMVVPRLQYHVTDRWYFDLNVPLSVLDLVFSSEKVENPNFTPEQQRTSTFSSELLPGRVHVRLGVGVFL